MHKNNEISLAIEYFLNNKQQILIMIFLQAKWKWKLGQVHKAERLAQLQTFGNV